MPRLKGTAIAIAGYAATALVAGALAGGSRDRANASSDRVQRIQPPARATDDRFPSLQALLYSRPDLSTARSLLALGGLTGKLDSARTQHTLFLPVDRAFRDQQGVSDALARPGNSGQLRRILKFHVVRGRPGLYAGVDLPTLTAERLAIRSYGKRWWAQDATILGGPLRFPGGVVYLVDGILIAPGQTVPTG